MTEFPWLKDKPTAAPEVIGPSHPSVDPLIFVRLKIRHGDTVKYVGIRADDTDITGIIELDDGTALTVKVWGVPTKSEPFMKSSEVMKEIGNYVKSRGLGLATE